jgi:hypothetical protein
MLAPVVVITKQPCISHLIGPYLKRMPSPNMCTIHCMPSSHNTHSMSAPICCLWSIIGQNIVNVQTKELQVGSS